MHMKELEQKPTSKTDVEMVDERIQHLSEKICHQLKKPLVGRDLIARYLDTLGTS